MRSRPSRSKPTPASSTTSLICPHGSGEFTLYDRFRSSMAATSTSTIWVFTIRLLLTQMSRAKKVGRPSGPAYGAFGAWDYNTEFVGQTGTFADGYILAWSAATDSGYSLKQAPLQPRIGLRAGLASGDRDKHGPNLQTFSPLFPTGFYFNQAILNGPLNEMGVHPNLTLHWGESVTLNGDWDWFWRERH